MEWGKELKDFPVNDCLIFLFEVGFFAGAAVTLLAMRFIAESDSLLGTTWTIFSGMAVLILKADVK